MSNALCVNRVHEYVLLYLHFLGTLSQVVSTSARVDFSIAQYTAVGTWSFGVQLLLQAFKPLRMPPAPIVLTRPVAVSSNMQPTCRAIVPSCSYHPQSTTGSLTLGPQILAETEVDHTYPRVDILPGV